MSRRGWWRRTGSTRRFRYVDAEGRPIRDDEQLERIRTLVIPPAWTDVEISPRPRARLQATGIDSAGRRQYLYHESFRAQQERRKFERLVDFGVHLPALRSLVRRDLQQDPYAEPWTCALAVRLVDRGWFRVGSDRNARASRTYGVTTLTRRHAVVSGDRVSLRFRGKNGTPVRATLADPVLAEGVEALLALGGGARLFRFENGDGMPRALTAPRLNAYIRAGLDGDFTAKDFRTWGGTLTAAVALAELGPTDDEAEATRRLAAAMRRVARELGNTPAVARGSYVSPVVVEQYRRGRTLERYASPRRSPRELSSDERALLRLLRAA